MDKFKAELEEYKAEVERLAKKSVVMSLLIEATENSYDTPAQFRGALINKLEELNDE